MIFIWLIKESLVSLWRHKLRSFFAIVGITVGITAVISLVSIGNGVKSDVTRIVEGIGTNLIVILSGNIDAGSGGFGQGSVGNPANFVSGDILKREDAEEINKVEGVEAASPMSLVAGNIRKDDKFSSSMVIGTNPQMIDIISSLKIKYGRFIEDSDQDKKVIVVGEAVREQIFGDKENVVGEKLFIGQDEFEIIGQFDKPQNSGELFSSDYESIAVISMDQAKRLNGGEDKIMRILASAESAENVDKAVENIKNNMMLRHSEDEFSVLTQEKLLDMFGDIIGVLTTAVSAIAAISLIVGGIGISSVMFMSVSDRTREIGIRKAIGATRSLILMQFLIESVVLSVLGGVVGLITALVVNRAIASRTPIVPELTTQVIVLALGFCIGVGILFGLIPAVRASLKDPVEALKAE